MSSYPDAITAFGRAIATARATRDALPPREAAEKAWTPGGPSVAELEARIRADRDASTAA